MDTSNGFTRPLRVENVDAVHWRLLEDFPWVGTQGDIFMVEKGMLTDFASVPWWTQSLIPRTGAWTKAAVVHDKMCDELNEYHILRKSFEQLVRSGYHFNRSAIVEPVKPVFNSCDTDAVFRKNARDLGTDFVRAELLWFGVRCGAIANPARREGWFTKGSFPRWCLDLVLILFVLELIVTLILWIHS